MKNRIGQLDRMSRLMVQLGHSYVRVLPLFVVKSKLASTCCCMKGQFSELPRTVCPSSVTAHIPGCAPFEGVLCEGHTYTRFTVVRGEMCVFSQGLVKAEAQGNSRGGRLLT